jgi:hypothetical protein
MDSAGLNAVELLARACFVEPSIITYKTGEIDSWKDVW